MTEMHHPSSLVRSVSSMGRVLRKQLWIWPLVAIVGLGGVNWWVRHVVDDTLKGQLASQLQTLLETDVTAFQDWFAAQEEHAQDVARNSQVRDWAAQLADVDEASGQAAKLLESPQLPQLQQMPQGPVESRCLRELYRSQPRRRRDRVGATGAYRKAAHAAIGKKFPPKVLAGKATASRGPYKSTVLILIHDGVPRAGVPTMFSAAPVTNDRGEVIACLGLRLRPERDFSRVLAAVVPRRKRRDVCD